MSNVSHGLEVTEVGISFAKLVGVNSTILSSPERASKVTPAGQAKKASPALLTFLPGICPTLRGQKSQLETVGRWDKEKCGEQKREATECTLFSAADFLPAKVKLGAGEMVHL